MRICGMSLVIAALLSLVGQGALYAAPPRMDANALVGQPADIAPSAYLYRSDRAAEENPPETEFLFNALKHGKAATLCGLLWEEPRPVRQVVLEWPASATSAPKPDQIALRWFPGAASASWWCRSDEGKKLQEAGPPVVSADGRQYTYTLDAVSEMAAPDNLVVAMRDGADPVTTLSVPVVRVLAPATWKAMDIVIEWGFQKGTEQHEYDGSIEAYNGIVTVAGLLADDSGTRMTEADNRWESRASGAGRRGVAARLLYIDYQDTAVWPGQARIEDTNRTIVTVRTKSGSFSFLPTDVDKGPVLAPEYGFYVAKASEPTTAKQFQKELAAKGLKTLREQIHARPEQSWEGAMRAVHTEVKGEFPPYPQPTVSAPMTVEVPEPYLTAAWKLGATNMLRSQKKDDRGKWRFRDHPYDALAHETHKFMRVLDLMGLHREARDGYEMWLDRMDTPVPPPDGLWVGGPDRLLSGIEWDTEHSGGISMIHLAMLDHYRLTGDKDWLTKNAAKLNANADWIIRQRKQYEEAIPSHEKLWAHGLVPPNNIWDNQVWRIWYETNASFCYAVQRHAEVIAEIDPEAGRRFAREAADFRSDLLAAVDKSLTLSPVIRVRDGTYHSFLPATPYMRGPASRFMPTKFCTPVPGKPLHSPGLYADAIRGGQHLAEFGLMPAGDPRMQGYLDVLEDRLLSENFKIYAAFKDYDPQKDWFSRSGWYYQCGLERTASIHLNWDDPACFLRTWLNQYAIEIIPGVWHFKEHTIEHPCMDKPFEEAAFLERFRNMLVMEEGDGLWLARATPRAWLEQGKKITVKNAPTAFGVIGYEIRSDADNGRITATVEMPSRNPPKTLFLRLRHPRGAAIKSVTVNGRASSDFSTDKERIELKGLSGKVEVVAGY